MPKCFPWSLQAASNSDEEYFNFKPTPIVSTVDSFAKMLPMRWIQNCFTLDQKINVHIWSIMGYRASEWLFSYGDFLLNIAQPIELLKIPLSCSTSASEHGYLVMSSICLIKYRCNRDVWYALQRLSRKKVKLYLLCTHWHLTKEIPRHSASLHIV